MARRDPVSRLRHDLRTPLNQIIGYTELLIEIAQDEAPAPAKVDDLERVLGAARTLLGMIDENVVRERLMELIESESAYDDVPAGGPAVSPESVPVVVTRQREDAPRGHILVVDDNPANCEVLQRRLERDGHTTAIANDGATALEMLAAGPYDLVLLDILMPGLDGHSVLARMKSDEGMRHIPVIMISALDRIETVVRCIEIGAEDYLPKPFDPTLLRARIGASLEKKALRDAERTHLATIERTQHRLASELAEASAYVRSILPSPVTDGPVRTDWRLVPSTELGGDALGYHWVDEYRFAAYLLDVSGHGVGAALLSATAIKVLLSGGLADVDFCDPGAVLTALNQKFQMEEQNNMFFTLWYGVLDRRWGLLSYASAGHPPAFLMLPGAERPQRLGLKGMVLGGMPDTVYRTVRCPAPPGSKLFIVSDGAYEIHASDGRAVLDYNGLETLLARAALAGDDELDQLVASVRALHGAGSLEDDLSILKLSVNAVEPKVVLEIEVYPEMSRIPPAIEQVEDFLAANAVSRRSAHAVQLAVEELLTNTLKYGHAGSPPKPMQVGVRLVPGEVLLTVIDRGSPFDPLTGTEPDISAPVENRDVGGLGLHLLRKLSIRQFYQRTDDTNVVSLVFTR